MDQQEIKTAELLRGNSDWESLAESCKAWLEAEPGNMIPKVILCFASQFSAKPDFYLFEKLFQDILYGKQLSDEEVRRLSRKQEEAALNALPARMAIVRDWLENCRDHSHADPVPVCLLCLRALVVSGENPERGVKMLEELANENPGRPDFYIALGYAWAGEKRSLYNRKALEVGPDYPPALYLVAGHETEAGNYADAQRLLERAVELYPEFAGAHFRLGNVLWKQGRKAEAEPHLRMVVTALPGTDLCEKAQALLEGKSEDIKETVFSKILNITMLVVWFSFAFAVIRVKPGISGVLIGIIGGGCVAICVPLSCGTLANILGPLRAAVVVIAGSLVFSILFLNAGCRSHSQKPADSPPNSLKQ